MTHLINAELLKLRTVRGVALTVAGLVAFVAFVAVSGMLQAGGPDGPSADELRDLVLGVGRFGVTGAVALGAGLVGAEYRRGLAVLDLLAVPVRPRVLLAKVVALAALGALLAAATSGVAVGVGLPLADAQGVELGLGGDEVLQAVAGGAAAGLLFAALGVFVGALTRNPAAAVAVVLLWQPLEALLGALEIGDVLPYGLVTSLTQDGPLAPLAALGLLAAYVVVLAAVTLRVAVPRDVA
jgi:hypothetical protein